MPSIILKADKPFSLDLTLSCGQVFRWDRAGRGWWYGVVGGKVIKIRQDGNTLTYRGVSRKFISHYFSLDADLPAITASFDRDPFIHAAIGRCHGLRLIRQPRWECLLSYIIATNSNIPTIRRRIASIAERYGRAVPFEGRTFYTFPDPGSISCEGSNALSCCRLGYREPYIFRTACDIPDRDAWEEEINALPYKEARDELMKLSGIGPKAADCILLFGFEKYEAFPVDVWIRRIMQENYIPALRQKTTLSAREYNAIRTFGREHFGEYCGYAQEYLYAAREITGLKN